MQYSRKIINFAPKFAQLRYKICLMNNIVQISSPSGTFATSVEMQGVESYSVKRTTSFSSIHKEVSNSLYNEPMLVSSSSSTFTSRRNSDREDQLDDTHTATGQEKPGSPVGDMLLPMLVMALVYVVVKLFRNRKTTQVL